MSLDVTIQGGFFNSFIYCGPFTANLSQESDGIKTHSWITYIFSKIFCCSQNIIEADLGNGNVFYLNKADFKRWKDKQQTEGFTTTHELAAQVIRDVCAQRHEKNEFYRIELTHRSKIAALRKGVKAIEANLAKPSDAWLKELSITLVEYETTFKELQKTTKAELKCLPTLQALQDLHKAFETAKKENFTEQSCKELTKAIQHDALTPYRDQLGYDLFNIPLLADLKTQIDDNLKRSQNDQKESKVLHELLHLEVDIDKFAFLWALDKFNDNAGEILDDARRNDLDNIDQMVKKTAADAQALLKGNKLQEGIEKFVQCKKMCPNIKDKTIYEKKIAILYEFVNFTDQMVVKRDISNADLQQDVTKELKELKAKFVIDEKELKALSEDTQNYYSAMLNILEQLEMFAENAFKEGNAYDSLIESLSEDLEDSPQASILNSLGFAEIHKHLGAGYNFYREEFVSLGIVIHIDESVLIRQAMLDLSQQLEFLSPKVLSFKEFLQNHFKGVSGQEIIADEFLKSKNYEQAVKTYEDILNSTAPCALKLIEERINPKIQSIKKIQTDQILNSFNEFDLKIKEALIAGKPVEARGLIDQALKMQVEPSDIATISFATSWTVLKNALKDLAEWTLKNESSEKIVSSHKDQITKAMAAWTSESSQKVHNGTVSFGILNDIYRKIGTYIQSGALSAKDLEELELSLMFIDIKVDLTNSDLKKIEKGLGVFADVILKDAKEKFIALQMSHAITRLVEFVSKYHSIKEAEAAATADVKEKRATWQLTQEQLKANKAVQKLASWKQRVEKQNKELYQKISALVENTPEERAVNLKALSDRLDKLGEAKDYYIYSCVCAINNYFSHHGERVRELVGEFLFDHLQKRSKQKHNRDQFFGFDLKVWNEFTRELQKLAVDNPKDGIKWLDATNRVLAEKIVEILEMAQERIIKEKLKSAKSAVAVKK